MSNMSMHHYECIAKGKEDHTPYRALVGCSSPFLWPWARRWINH